MLARGDGAAVSTAGSDVGTDAVGFIVGDEVGIDRATIVVGGAVAVVGADVVGRGGALCTIGVGSAVGGGGSSFFLRGVGGVGGVDGVGEDVSLLLLHALAPATANVSQ